MVVWLCASGFTHAATESSHDARNVEDLEDAMDESEVKAVEVDTAMESLVSRLLNRQEKHPPSQGEMVGEGVKKMNVDAAARRLESKLPEDIANLVRTSVKDESHQPFAESSLAKARKYLNALTVKAWKELDDKLIACKEFEDKNRISFKQVMTQIATLSANIADLAKSKAQSTEQ